MKIDRLIGILSILLKNEKVTAPYLAERFEVSRRTINRDVEDLCKAGIPLVTTQGTGGGISIAPGYKIDKTLITYKEMQSIILGLKSLDSVSDNNNYKQLMDKLETRENITIEQGCYDQSGHILINLSSHYKSSLAPKIEIIRTAIEKKRYIAFDYYYPKGESKRYIEPYLLVFEWSNWYVCGYCTDRKDFRMFKLNRMLGVTLDDNHFSGRELPSFQKDMQNYFSKQYHIIAKFASSVKYRLIEEYGVESFLELETGDLVLEMDFTNKENLISWILSFGDKVELIEPKELRKEYITLIKNINRIYKKQEET